MSDKILRQKLIRLAHANPSLRKEILPLLKQARTRSSDIAKSDSFVVNYDVDDDEIVIEHTKGIISEITFPPSALDEFVALVKKITKAKVQKAKDEFEE